MDLVTSIPLIAGIIGHTCLTVLLLNRRAYRNFPFFVCYQAYATLALTARLATFLAQRSKPYFFTFWSSELGFLVLAIAASHEVFRWVFSGFYRLPWFRAFYYGGIGLTIVIVGINSLLHVPVNVHPLVGRILPFGIVINGIQAAIFALFFLLVKLLDMGFRRYPFGIALGLGIASVGALIPYVARSIFGTELENLFLYAPTVAYFVGLLVWLSAFLKSEPDDAMNPPMRPEDMAEEVGQYVGF
jgi:hypothetical protein